jgi:hypothetical protein
MLTIKVGRSMMGGRKGACRGRKVKVMRGGRRRRRRVSLFYLVVNKMEILGDGDADGGCRPHL